MVYLTITPAILNALDVARGLHLNPGDANNDELLSSSHQAIGNPINHSQIIALSKLLANHNTSHASASYHLDQLLKGSKVYNEPRKQKPEPVIHSSTNYLTLLLCS